MTPLKSVPQVPMVNAGELYVNGLQLSMNADEPTLYINVARGAARDSKNVNDIVIQDDSVAKFDRQGLNGLDTGVLMANELYAVYAIGSSIATLGNGQASSLYPAGILLSREFERPYMPSGYDMFRRIGAIAIDNTGEIVPFVQIGNDTRRTMKYGLAAEILSIGNQDEWTEILINEYTPAVLMPYIATNVYLRAAFLAPDTLDSFYLQPKGQPTSAYYAVGNVAVANETFTQDVVCPCSSDAVINYQVDDSSDTLSLFLLGYDDLL